MPSGVTGHRSISNGMAWLREASCSSSRVMGPVVGVAGAVGSVGAAGAVGAGVATAAPSAVRRVLTLMLPVWAPGTVVSLEFALGNEAPLGSGAFVVGAGVRVRRRAVGKVFFIELVFGARAPGQ